MATQPKTLTPAEFLAIERKAEFKSEYIRGEVFAMAGGTRNHSLIAGNVALQFRLQMRGRDCEVHGSDLRIWAGEALTYADVAVICGRPAYFDDLDTVMNPMAIAEVLSRSTESYDRGLKFEMYRSIVSLRQHLLVAQDRIHADLYIRTDTGWLLTSADGPDASLEFAGCPLKLSDVYEKVDLSPQA
jgi:Uma2 family endonuclease